MNQPAKENSNSAIGSPGQTSELGASLLTGKRKRRRILVFVLVLTLFAVALLLTKRYFDFDQLVAREVALKDYYRDHPWLVLSAAFLIYVIVTGLSIPVSTGLSLFYAWFFGFVRATILISFASTAGATLAFLICRYVLRDYVQDKFRTRIRVFNSALEKEGAFYLFMMRLVPVVPFFVVNAVMGLTKMKTITFWWVSQLGMISVTAVYVYAGSRIPDLETLQAQGVKAVFSPWQFTQITFAFALVGILPYLLKRIVEYRRSSQPPEPEDCNL